MILALCLCLASAAGAVGSLSDPLAIGVGARALGMGKAYVGLAENSDALFMNPAGLARINGLQFSSMSGSLLGEVNYQLGGVVYPLGGLGTVGFGYVGTSVGGIQFTDATAAPTGTGDWGNSVMFLSYGSQLLNTPLLFGGSLKYFKVGGSGTADAVSAAGSGYDLDLGLLYPVNGFTTLGANWQDCLPASLGGKISKTAGDENIPATLKLGGKMTLLGREGEALLASNSRRLYGCLDYDLCQNSGKTGALHAGLEFWPSRNFALRAGSDRSDLTAGVGLRFSGFEFDYAYHLYGEISENATHYFSLAYLGEGPTELNVKLNTPRDHMVVYDDHVSLSGQVKALTDDGWEKDGPFKVKVNGQPLQLLPGNSFESEVPVESYGKKKLVVEVVDDGGNRRVAELEIVRLTAFADVPDGYWAKQSIERNGTLGLVPGYADGTFKPENPLTRADMVALLLRAKGLTPPAEGTAKAVFKDVKPDFWAAKYLELAWKEGLVRGYPDGTFRPNNHTSRVESVVLMTRFDGVRPVAMVEGRPYNDVAADHWAAGSVAAARDAGMIGFTSANRLEPQAAVTRSQLADMFSRTAVAGGRIKDLLTWEKGRTGY
ncbi:MAG: PorV/PorQ family protein [Candidatus Saganbacteria bacterium]|nr:PorV/PorQ family protein [Candidatus Saganbacteria bacterium]